MNKYMLFILTTALTLLAMTAMCGLSIGNPPDPAAQRTIPEFTVPPVREDVPYLRFMAIGDMGTGRPDQYTVAEAMTSKATRDGLDFILTVGDNIYEHGVDSVDDLQWQTKFEKVYADPVLDVPFFATLGNHDYRGSIQAQIEYTEKSERWNMPAAYYTFTRSLGDGASVQFFALDTTPIHKRENVSEQLEWLDDRLEKSEATWKICYGHHPLYSHSVRNHDTDMIAQVESLFIEHGVDLYLAGHDHTLEMLKPVSGVNYVVTGAGGGPDKAYNVTWTDESYYASTGGGYTWYRLAPDELVIEFVRLNGETQYAHTLRK